jgi:DNA-binding transcriptional ArsR family regulator
MRQCRLLSPDGHPSDPATHHTITTGETAHPFTTLLTRAGETHLSRDVTNQLLHKSTALFVVAAIESRRNRKGRTVALRQDVLMGMLAREGQRPDAITAAVKVAVAAKVLDTPTRRHKRAPYVYRVRSIPGRNTPETRYDKIPNGFFVDVASGRLKPATISTLLVLLRALGDLGRTSDHAGEIARTMGISERTVRRHVVALETCGYVTVQHWNDGGWMLTAVDTNAGSTRTQMRGPLQTPVCLQTPEASPASSRSDADLSDAREPRAVPAKAKAPKVVRSQHKRKPKISPEIARVYAAAPPEFRGATPEDQSWGPQSARYLAAKWRNGAHAKIKSSLEAGLSTDAACAGLANFADFDVIAPGQRAAFLHIPGIGAALHTQTVQIRQGNTCRGCGLDRGHTPTCPQGAELSESDRAAVASFWARESA